MARMNEQRCANKRRGQVPSSVSLFSLILMKQLIKISVFLTYSGIILPSSIYALNSLYRISSVSIFIVPSLLHLGSRIFVEVRRG